MWRVGRLVEKSWFGDGGVGLCGEKLVNAVQNGRGVRIGIEAARDSANCV